MEWNLDAWNWTWKTAWSETSKQLNFGEMAWSETSWCLCMRFCRTVPPGARTSAGARRWLDVHRALSASTGSTFQVTHRYRHWLTFTRASIESMLTLHEVTVHCYSANWIRHVDLTCIRPQIGTIRNQQRLYTTKIEFTNFNIKKHLEDTHSHGILELFCI